MVFDIFISIMFAVYVIYNEHKRIKLLEHMLGIINVQSTTVDRMGDCIEHTDTIFDILKEKDKSPVNKNLGTVKIIKFRPRK